MNPQTDPPQFDLRSQMPPAPAQGPAGMPSGVGPDAKSQILERLKGAVNVLVTVSANPTVDQLAAAIGFTLVLNKLKKHGTAVFSGETPSTIEFLQPEKTLEKDTNSLRDFIVALDKSKADKLRYKVEDKFVKIFITPYHTSLSENDLEFGQGDFNVDVIIALGVGRKEELDQAITAHGRILHDATVVSITKSPGDDMGAINWHVPEASSFCEILVDVADSLKSPQTELFDEQIATAFLTGIVAETDRFSNNKTTPQTMNMAAILMKAGANQQLIATKLDEPAPLPEVQTLPPQPLLSMTDSNTPLPPQLPPMPSIAASAPSVAQDGSLLIPHIDTAAQLMPDFASFAMPPPAPDPVNPDEIHIDDEGMLHKFGEEPAPEDTFLSPAAPAGDLPAAPSMSAPSPSADHDDQTLEEIERAVNSPHVNQNVPAIDVMGDTASAPAAPDPSGPPAALNALPVDIDMGHGDQPSDTNGTPPPPSTPPDLPPPLMPPAPM